MARNIPRQRNPSLSGLAKSFLHALKELIQMRGTYSSLGGMSVQDAVNAMRGKTPEEIEETRLSSFFDLTRY